MHRIFAISAQSEKVLVAVNAFTRQINLIPAHHGSTDIMPLELMKQECRNRRNLPCDCLNWNSNISDEAKVANNMKTYNSVEM